MKTLRRILLSSLAPIILIPAVAYACSCIPDNNPNNAFKEGNVVFRGTVIQKQNTSDFEIVYTFTVDTVWQGSQSSTIQVYSAAQSATCGVGYEIGQKTIVIANENNGRLRAQLCSQIYSHPQTGEPLQLEEVVKYAPSNPNEPGPSCQPYICQDGTQHPSCTVDGTPINYFVHPCFNDNQPPSSTTFSDVPPNHIYAKAIAWAKQYGIVQGYSDGTFRPDYTINRAEFVKILLEANNISLQPQCRIAAFIDAPLSTWYGPYVHAARCRGIVQGYLDGTFRPNSTINLAEAAKIIVKSSGAEVRTHLEGEQWFSPYFLYLFDRSAMLPNTSPGHLITRGEMVEILYRIHLSAQT